MTDIERLCERLDAATKARFRQSTLDIADHEDSHVTVKLIKEASSALRQSEQKLREAKKERGTLLADGTTLDIKLSPLGEIIDGLEKRLAEAEQKLREAASISFGWLIERTDIRPPQYWAGWNMWSSDHMKAVRFCRQEDAFHGAVEYGHGIPTGAMHAIREHSWFGEELHPTTVNGQAEQKAAQYRELAKFGLAVLEESRVELADLDGGWIQDSAEALGLLERIEVKGPCGEACHCAEYGDFPQECLRYSEAVSAIRKGMGEEKT